MFSNIEIVVIIWCICILINSIYTLHENTFENNQHVWDIETWVAYFTSLVFAPILTAILLVDTAPEMLNNIFTTPRTLTKEKNGNER